MRKGKRVEVYLPDGHPILSIPPGMRSRTVRESLDLAFWLKEQLQSITDRLVQMEKRLERVEGAIASGKIEAKRPGQNQEPTEAGFDVDAFTDI